MGYGEHSVNKVEVIKTKHSIFYKGKNISLNIEGLYAGQAIFLICNGPSIDGMNLIPLDTRQTFGINNGGILRPKFWTAQDPAAKFSDAIWLDPTITKIVPHPRAGAHFWDSVNHCDSKITIGQCPSVIYHHKVSECDAENWLDATCIQWGVPRGKGHRLNTMIAALHIIWFLGFRTVYIIGADFHMTTNPYFFDEEGSSGKAAGNNALYALTNAYLEKLDPLCQERGYNIFNCTDGGNLTALRRVSYTDALKATEISTTRETLGMYARQKSKRGILYYSHNILDGTKLNDACRQSLIDSELPITSVTREPIDFGHNLVVDLPPTLGSMLRQVIHGLENMTEDFIYFAEHDCIYHPSHFDIISGHITFNTNMWRLTPLGYWQHAETKPVLSACMGPRKQLLRAMKHKLVVYKEREHLYKNHKYVKMLYEPGRGGGQSGKQIKCFLTSSEQPCIDVRHGKNASSRGWSARHTHKQTLPYWGDAREFRNTISV